MFAIAGLWRLDNDDNYFTMLTTWANVNVSPFHHRMPFILQPEHWEVWLGDDWKSAMASPDRQHLDKFQ
jgi:putative SOS response-associated peptidase YedK